MLIRYMISIGGSMRIGESSGFFWLRASVLRHVFQADRIYREMSISADLEAQKILVVSDPQRRESFVPMPARQIEADDEDIDPMTVLPITPPAMPAQAISSHAIVGTPARQCDRCQRDRNDLRQRMQRADGKPGFEIREIAVTRSERQKHEQRPWRAELPTLCTPIHWAKNADGREGGRQVMPMPRAMESSSQANRIHDKPTATVKSQLIAANARLRHAKHLDVAWSGNTHRSSFCLHASLKER